jgi:hypothetical protein
MINARPNLDCDVEEATMAKLSCLRLLFGSLSLVSAYVPALIFIAPVFIAPVLIAPVPARAAAPPQLTEFDYLPIGAPRSTGKIVMQVTIVINGVPVTKTVTVPSGAIKPSPQAQRLPGDTDAQFAQKIADARGDGSQAKAAVIVAAINTAFANAFMGTGLTVATETIPVTKTINVGGVPIKDVTATYGGFVIPNVDESKGTPIVFKENGVLGEGGNGGSFRKRAGPSPGATGSLERITPGVQTVSTGVNANGHRSEVDFGIDGTYVAKFSPNAGMTDDEILQTLDTMLNAHGVAADFDAADADLILANPVPDGTVVDWGDTDTGLGFAFSMQGLAQPIPEPSSLALFGAGCLALLGFRILGKRRAKTVTGAK